MELPEVEILACVGGGREVQKDFHETGQRDFVTRRPHLRVAVDLLARFADIQGGVHAATLKSS